MSNRKSVRDLIRGEGERKGVNASRYLSRKFDQLQIKKYGLKARRANQARGTHKRSTWRTRLADI